MSMKHTVLVIVEDNSLRALLIAQLNEDGLLTTGIRSVAELVSGHAKAGGAVSLVVLDSEQQHVNTQSLEQLNKIYSGVPLVVLHSGYNLPHDLNWKGRIHYINRPVTIGEIVWRIKAIVENGPVA
jgi:DNA-binding NtrC family response regulator